MKALLACAPKAKTALRFVLQAGLALAVLAALLIPYQAITAASIPTISIVSVEAGQTVTIRTHNFPANTTFDVLMGAYGTLGINGIGVSSTKSGEGGSFEATYKIPAELKGSYRIAIRMQSASGYFAYNWFYNSAAAATGTTTTGTTTTAGYSGIPTFKIVSVVTDEKVTIRTYNFPADQTFTVRLGKYGTLGINGVAVSSQKSGEGGSFEATYPIPDELKGETRIAIRLDSAAGYFAYNWFYNNSTGAVPGSTGTSTGYTGIPTFKIVSVEKDKSVTIRTSNFPANQTFSVLMGAYGTLGINGIGVSAQKSGEGGSFEATYPIPDELKGMARIAIRLDSKAGYYAYNWFYNNTASAGTSGTSSVTTAPGYTGIPTFKIIAVERDKTVEIRTYNFPPNQTFSVRMGTYGTLGINGVEVGGQKSGEGGSFTATYSIPAELRGSARIAIRLDSAAGYYAYNWFYNNSTK